MSNDETPEDERNNMTDLERVGTAHITAFSAWLYPDDHEVRETAVMAAALCGVDYIDAVALTMENSTMVDAEMIEKPGVSADVARYAVAESFRKLAQQMVAQGASVRRMVTMAPWPPEQADDDDYGSLE